THFRQDRLSGIFTVLASAPNNPFTRNVRVSVPITLADRETAAVTSWTSHALAGLKLSFAHGWTAAVESSFDRNDLEQSFPAQFLLSTVAQRVSTGAIDVFAAPPNGALDLSEFAVEGTQVPPSHSSMITGSLRVGGPAFSLPAGPILFTGSLEVQRQ